MRREVRIAINDGPDRFDLAASLFRGIEVEMYGQEMRFLPSGKWVHNKKKEAWRDLSVEVFSVSDLQRRGEVLQFEGVIDQQSYWKTGEEPLFVKGWYYPQKKRGMATLWVDE